MSSTEAMIKLKSSNGEVFEVEKAVAAKSRTLKDTMNAFCDDDDDDEAIPLPNVTWKIAEKVFEYCKRHVEAEAKATGELIAALEEFDAEFVEVDQSTLKDIILTAHYLEIESLFCLTCGTLVKRVWASNRSPEALNVKNDPCRENEDTFLNLIYEKVIDVMKGKTTEEVLKSLTEDDKILKGIENLSIK